MFTFSPFNSYMINNLKDEFINHVILKSRNGINGYAFKGVFKIKIAFYKNLYSK